MLFRSAEDIDVERAKRARESAEAAIRQETDPNQLELAKARLSRANARLKAAEKL